MCFASLASALTATDAVRAADVYLLQADGCAQDSGIVTRTAESSFLTNNTYKDGTYQWGWSDGKDPNDQTDYLIGQSLMVRAILSSASSTETLTFPGRKLTLNKGYLAVVNSGTGNGICVNDLLIKAGTVSASAGNVALNLYGTITIDASSYGYPSKVAQKDGSRWYQANGGPTFAAAYVQGSTAYTGGPMTHLKAKLIAAPPNNVAISGCNTPLAWYSTKNAYYMMEPSQHFHFGFDGDCSEYFATNCVYPKTTVTVNTEDFGGSFMLSNLSQVMVGPDVTTARIKGGIVARDGWVEVQSGKTLEVGDLDFDFAGTDTYVAASGTNVYLGTLYDPAVPFEDNTIQKGNSYQRKNWAHSTTWVTKQFRNAIYLGWSVAADSSRFPAAGTATLKARSATLRDTLVISDYAGSTMTVGDLTLDGTRLDYSSKLFTLAITNSLTVGRKVKITPPNMSNTYRKTLLTLAAGKGSVDTDDFELADGYDAVRYSLVVEKNAAGETLCIEDRAYASPGAQQGYVFLKNGEDGGYYSKRSLYEAGYWSDGLAPHTDTNYYAGANNTGAYRLIADRDGDYTFPGRVLSAQSLFFRVMKSGTLTIKEFRFPTRAYSRIYTDGTSDCHPTIAGDMSVLATADGYYGLFDSANTVGLGTITVRSTLHGWYNAVLEIRYAKYNDNGGILFLGDNSDYRGLFRVREHSHLTLGGGAMPGTVRLQAADSGLTIAGADGATAEVGFLVSSNANATAMDVVRVTVAPTNALCVSALEINGKLAKLGTGVFGAKTATANALNAESGAIDVKAGFLRTYAPGAFDGVPLAFADGTGISVDLDESDMTLKETGFKTAGAMTSTGIFKVKIAGDFSDLEQVRGRTVTLMTVPTAFADSVENRIRVVNPAKGLGAQVSREPAGDGLVKFMATINQSGMVVIIR